MSVLTVVRHGQASFLSEDYDRLSALGEQQARLLGEYWLDRGVRFDRVVYGPRERQIRTGEIIGELYGKAGAGWPEPAVREELDEYPAEEVVRALLPGMMAADARLAGWARELKHPADRLAQQRAFDRILREVSRQWARGEAVVPGVPTWEEFCHGVETAVAQVRQECPRSGRAVMFTSGGPKSATVRVALGLSYEATLELTWSPKNCSVSEFLFSGERFSLHTFNATPHLDHPGLITYR